MISTIEASADGIAPGEETWSPPKLTTIVG
jgi:hypothetical protein